MNAGFLSLYIRMPLASVKRILLVARRGFFCRSMYSPSCLRRNRFSAARADGERRVRRKKDSASMNTPTTLRTNSTSEERLDMPESIAQSASPEMQLRLLGSDEVFADHN